MPNQSVTNLITHLARSEFDKLIGLEEGGEIEFKRAPYQLKDERYKWELSKDIAAFANSQGGYIVIGIAAARSDSQLVEAAESITMVRKSLVNSEQLLAIADERIIPPVKDISLKWYSGDDDTSGILVIQVPSQENRLKPFLVRRMIDADGATLHAVGWPVRNGDRVEWIRPDVIQQKIWFSQNVLQPVPERRTKPDRENARSRGNEHLQMLGFEAEPSILIQIIPTADVDLLPQMFCASGIVTKLASWEGVRRGGFDLAVSSAPETLGSSILTGTAHWKLRIDEDGWMQVAAKFSDDFLGWAMRYNMPPDTLPRLNSIALVEFVDDFFKFFELVILPITTEAGWHCRVRVINMRSNQVQFLPGPTQRLFWYDARIATSDDYEQDFAVGSSAEESNAVNCLTRIYALWGMGRDAIPLVKDGKIDRAAFKRI